MKVNDIRSQGKHNCLLNGAVLLVIAVAAWLMFPAHGPIGTRNMLVLNLVYGVGTLWFMWALEKYAAMITGLYEKIVSSTLAAVYMLAVMVLLNLSLFGDWFRLVHDAVLTLVSIGCLAGEDVLLEQYNAGHFRLPRLLIIDYGSHNFWRMKRIKYGVLKQYDAWYEDVGSSDPDSFQSFVDRTFPKFDAICVLNGFPLEEYHIAVSRATELNKELFIVPEMIDAGKTNAKIVHLDDILTLYMPKAEISRAELFAKRCMDILLAGVGLLVALIPIGAIALAIKLTSPGPIIYRQTRCTKGKQEFQIYKFRTMIPDAEKFSGPKFAEKDDPRITPVGKVLRSLRLDELPQLVNILKGEMSVVGPRPERPEFIRQFEKSIERYNDRFLVKAGLTSLSHVYGRYSTYIHDRTYYDLFYITNYSLLLDLKIILLTTKTLFLKSAAEGEDQYKEKTVAAAGKGDYSNENAKSR